MPLSNAERQKRWIEKNRALHNLRRRKKNLSEGREVAKPKTDGETSASSAGLIPTDFVGSNPTPPQLSKVDELRQLMKKASAESTIPTTKPLIYRNDYGQVISETQWNVLKKRKQHAENNGYVIDEYSQ